ncbi:MAG: efflux RND transporter periplasmic adaptor subunit [Prochloraceae cyanobacterium]
MTQIQEQNEYKKEDNISYEQKNSKRSQQIKNLRKKIIYTVAGLGTLTLIVLAMRPTPIEVDTKKIDREDFYVTVDAEGKTRVKSRYIVSAPVEGRLGRIKLDEGDRVVEGMPIAQIDPLPQDTRVRQARHQLQELQAQKIGVETLRPKLEAIEKAKANINKSEAGLQEASAKVLSAEAALNQATRDRERLETLVLQGAIPTQELEIAQLSETTRRTELEAAKRTLDSRKAELVAAKHDLSVIEAERNDPDYMLGVYNAQIDRIQAELAKLADDAARTTIYAPDSGHVLRVLQESEKYIREGTPIIELGDRKKIELVIDVLSTDAVTIEPGDPIIIDRWGGETNLEAKVKYIEPAAFTEISALGVEEQRVNVIAEIIEPPATLGDGYRVDTRIVVYSGEDVLVVPLSAIFRCNDRAWCTFVVEGNKAIRREITIKKRNSLAAIVETGLKSGETVILYPSEQIQSGNTVRSR